MLRLLLNVFIAAACVMVAATLPLSAQTQPAAPTSQPAAPAATVAQPVPSAPVPPDLAMMLSHIEQAAQATAVDLGKLRIEKWKADSAVRQQSQENVDSVQRNISSALSGMVQQARMSPASVGAQFKLYRNLNALYEVLSSVTESAGAFGAKNEFQALSTDLSSLDQARRTLADRLATATAQQDSELARLRAMQARAAAAAAAAAQPPKKIVVDDSSSSAKKAARPKKKPPAPQPPQ